VLVSRGITATVFALHTPGKTRYMPKSSDETFKDMPHKIMALCPYNSQYIDVISNLSVVQGPCGHNILGTLTYGFWSMYVPNLCGSPTKTFSEGRS